MTLATLSVAEVALKLDCSTRRVRQLIADRRLMARKDDKGCWRVIYPLDMRMGRRGPRLGSFKPAARSKSAE